MKIVKGILWLLMGGGVIAGLWLAAPEPVLPDRQETEIQAWSPKRLSSPGERLRQASRFLLQSDVVEGPSRVKKLDIQLLGIVKTDDELTAMVAIDKESQRLAVGYNFADGSVLDAIIDNSLIINHKGKVEIISLYKDAKQP